MHRAFYLPEIVTAMIRAGKTEPGLLYSCLLVNRLFHHEACRILWKGCYGIFGVAHVTPKIDVLANMVLRDDIGRERAQFYANFIRVLVFQQDDLTGNDDARWHPQLRQLRFPLLEDLNIWKTDSAMSSNTEEVILHYVHSGLRDLRVDASGLLGDHFLDEVSRLCPKLQQLDIDFKNVAISQEGLARFFKCMTSLQGIHVAALDASWSVEAFAAVAEYERLKLLHIPTIDETWFGALRLRQHSAIFPDLEYFYCLNITGKALHHLHEFNPRLLAIHIYNDSLAGPEDVLEPASKFSRLVNFRYQPGPKAKIQGQDLLKLANNCPHIVSLSIGQDQTPLPAGSGIGDDVLYSLARSLPALTDLYLLITSPSPPSIASITSAFSQHCPSLKRLEICCGSDWGAFMVEPSAFLFPNLWTIALHPQVHIEDVLEEEDFRVLLLSFRESAEYWFPKVEFFNIDDADDWEQQLNDHMFHVGYKREYGSEIESVEEVQSWNESDNADESVSRLTKTVADMGLASD